MAWRMVPQVAGRYREVTLAVAFLGMAAYEAFEMWVLEQPHGSAFSLRVAVHSLQVVAILMATYVFPLRWPEKRVCVRRGRGRPGAILRSAQRSPAAGQPRGGKGGA